MPKRKHEAKHRKREDRDMIKDIMKYEQFKDLYTNYIKMKSMPKSRDFTNEGGDIFVTIRTDKRNYRKIRERY